jgi:hypothetical protein
MHACIINQLYMLVYCILHTLYKPTTCGVCLGADDADGAVDLPGVVQYGDRMERYMLHNETVVQVNGSVRTDYRFASVPGWVKVEVINVATRMGAIWQEEVRSHHGHIKWCMCVVMTMMPP